MEFQQRVPTVLLAYVAKEVPDTHITVSFKIQTPENFDLIMKVMNELYRRLPSKVSFRVSDEIKFNSAYNAKMNKYAYEVYPQEPQGAKILTVLDKIERFNQSLWWPHVSWKKVELPFLKDCELRLTQKTMKSSLFSGFAQYKYNWIMGTNLSRRPNQ